MGKYEALRGFLANQQGDRIPLTFDEIETLIGGKLPASKRYPAWWSNNPSNNVMTRVWLDAGFETEQVDTQAERLVFRRSRLAQGAQGRKPIPSPFGCMKGTFRIPPDVDLTEPADPEWGKVFE